MALVDSVLRDEVADALLDAIDRSRERFALFVVAFIDWLRQVAEPPPGVELESADGSKFSGLALIERNRVVLMLAVRQRPELEDAPIEPSPAPERSLFTRPGYVDRDAPWRDPNYYRR